ncbi:MAG: acyl-CoA/acyl-ACP dehydrogenase [Calothrix sp. C42_A2020_038]|nr:acyl-CoA/acyl-ACP dehydrogenase [Calothrix sp. C42_A2020_038]
MNNATITTQPPQGFVIERQSTIAQTLKSAVEIADYCAANASNVDVNGAFPVQEFKLIAEAGLLAAPLQRELGGWGAGFDAAVTHETLMLLKHIGRGNLAVGRVYEGHVNALQLIQTLGNIEQIQMYASDARNGKVFGVWNAEANDGVKVIPLDNGKYRLEGSKTFCSGAGFVERPFVNGALPDGSWQMCIVPMEEVATVSDPSWWQPLGMRATASYKIDFTGVELEQSSLIGNPGDYYRQPWLSGGVVRFAAVQLGGAEALFNLTREYLQKLGYTNDPYQKERVARMAIGIESGNLWLRGAADFIANYAPIFAGYPIHPQPKAEQLVAYANMVRTAIEQICIDIMQLCERSVGTRGLMPQHQIERIIRDLTLYLRQPAFDAALSNVGEYVLSDNNPAHFLWRDE